MKEVRVVFVVFLFVLGAFSLSGCTVPLAVGASMLANGVAAGGITKWVTDRTVDKCMDLEESKDLSDRERRREMAANNCSRVGIAPK